ncbi:GroES-like protein [Microthyrium microscopicum]|uniref:GroES-like protein n=1 Tax=Microthyrium microscopicum TaxID=703497 RepID=A0A6A6UAE2_9PEZI|nr:GroES-like protein [Microthyrium microscopicum]
MKAISVAEPGAEWKVIDTAIPEPDDDQILVKIIYTGFNPVDTFQAVYGLLVQEWPLTPGCDLAGVVVKAGKNAISPLGKPFKEGDKVCGCSRLGPNKFQTYQEYNIMDAALATPVPDNLDLVGACAVGSGSYTAGLAIFGSLEIPVPKSDSTPSSTDEWVLILGGGSNVGRMAIQMLKGLGYKVITTASARSFDVMTKIGADTVVDYKQDEAAIIAEIASKTDGKLYKVFDAVAANLKFSIPLFAALKGDEHKKVFTSTNDWDPKPETSDFLLTDVKLGPIGQPQASELNGLIKSFIPFVHNLLEQDKIVTTEYIVQGNGVDAIPDVAKFHAEGKGGNKKVMVKCLD